jgi:maleylpyruvate isomerase
MTTTYRLHNYWRSSASWRVRIAFALKGLAYEYVAVNIIQDGGEQNRPTFRALNPQTQVPLLEVVTDGASRFLAQSLPILEFLDETRPETTPLLPADPYVRARVRQLAEAVNSGIQPLQNLPILAEVERGLVALEALAAESAGRFLVGDTPSLADACLLPQLYSARRFQLDTAPFPTLERVEAACYALPGLDATRPERQPDAVA